MMLSSIPPLAVAGLILTFTPIAIFIAMPFLIRARLTIKKTRGTITRWQDRVQLRFRNTGTYTYMFAWWKMRLDPMFRDLPKLLAKFPSPHVTLDLGCGYGVAGNCLLEWCPDATVYGLDPDPARVPVAATAFDSRGKAFQSAAPEFEVAGLPDKFDTVLCLDMLHFLSDEQVQTTFNRLYARLLPGGHFFLRSLLPPPGDGGSFLWNLQVWNRKIVGGVVHHRPADKIKEMLANAGFVLERSHSSSKNGELHWFISKRMD